MLRMTKAYERSLFKICVNLSHLRAIKYNAKFSHSQNMIRY